FRLMAIPPELTVILPGLMAIPAHVSTILAQFTAIAMDFPAILPQLTGVMAYLSVLFPGDLGALITSQDGPCRHSQQKDSTQDQKGQL
ncbi:MAG: hypothetical protein ACE5ID_06670, partial [Acidobacteriota bacterium]